MTLGFHEKLNDCSLWCLEISRQNRKAEMIRANIPSPNRSSKSLNPGFGCDIPPDDGGRQQQHSLDPCPRGRATRLWVDICAESPLLHKVLSRSRGVLRRNDIHCSMISRSRAFSDPSSSHSASSSAVRFLLTGRTLLMTSLIFSSGSCSRGTSCVGSGDAVDDTERADEGTSSANHACKRP